MVSYEFVEGDYIRFTQIVQAEQKVRHRTDYMTGRALVVPAIPEQVLPQGGEGRILRVIGDLRKVNGAKHRVARVYAGAGLGTVTAILDDAVLVAKQPSLFDMASTDTGESSSMYGTDARGGA